MGDHLCGLIWQQGLDVYVQEDIRLNSNLHSTHNSVPVWWQVQNYLNAEKYIDLLTLTVCI